MNTTIGMWEMVSELLEGEKLPVSINEALEGLCNGDLVIAERHEFRKLEADNHALKTQIELLRKPVELTDEEIKECCCFLDVRLHHRYEPNAVVKDIEWTVTGIKDFVEAILRKASEK